MSSPDDPFGYLDDAAQQETEDREAEALLSEMMADGDSYVRDRIRLSQARLSVKGFLPDQPGQAENS